MIQILKQMYRIVFPSPPPVPHPEYGGSGITEDCYNWIRENIKQGSPVLEFGAGLVSTAKLSQLYDLTSVEHNEAFIGAFPSKYIYAPLSDKNGWYQESKVAALRNEKFELVIIDGPPGSGNRFGILLYVELIANANWILVDDSNRPGERILVELLAKELNRPVEDYEFFSVIGN